MTKLGVYAFKSVEDPVEDALLLRRMKLLSFLETDVSVVSLMCNALYNRWKIGFGYKTGTL